jgi:hypothetical protein
MSDPFDLADTTSYLAWRAAKLSNWPCDTEPLRVEVEHLADPQSAEMEAIQSRVAKCNLALIACSDPTEIGPTPLLAFGRHLGLCRLDNNPCADERAVSVIAVRPTGRASEYIPYTNRPLSWHTDGYYTCATPPGHATSSGNQAR